MIVYMLHVKFLFHEICNLLKQFFVNNVTKMLSLTHQPKNRVLLLYSHKDRDLY